MKKAHLRAQRNPVYASLFALLLVACGGSANAHDPSASGDSGGGGTDGVSGGTSNPGHAASGGMDPGNASGGSAGASSSGSGGSIAGGSGGVLGGGVAGASSTGGSGGSTARSCDHITFDDPALEAVVRKSLSKPQGEITPEEAQGVSYLSAMNANITSLGGVECLGLIIAQLGFNHVSDLSPLAAQKKLQQVDLSNNPVGDLSPLAELPAMTNLNLSGAARTLTTDDLAKLVKIPALFQLTLRFDTIDSLAALGDAPALNFLNISNSQLIAPESLAALTHLSLLDASDTGLTPKDVAAVTSLSALVFELNLATDISPLASLTNLTELDLSYNNKIADISSLASLTKLERLALIENQVVDLSPLSGLTNLNTLNVQANAIKSITPLVQNTGLGMGDVLWLSENPLDCQAEAANLAALSARQVGVLSDCGASP